MTSGRSKTVSDRVTLPDGRRAQLWQGGASAGATVFFMHGCPDCRLAARTGEGAARRTGVRLVAVNRPGYGSSDAHESGQVSVAHDTCAVADVLGIEQFAVLGMSVGGIYALACAALHPDRVTATGLVASPGIIPEMHPPWHRDDLSSNRQRSILELSGKSAVEVVELLRPDFEAYVARIQPDDTDDVAVASRWMQDLHPQDMTLMEALPPADVADNAREALLGVDGYLRDTAAMFRSWEVRPEQVRCPTWLWYGARDANAPVRHGEWLAERIGGARLVVDSRSAHLTTLVRNWDAILSELSRATR